MTGQEVTATIPLDLDADELRQFVAHDIWAHTGHDDDCSICGAYEPCRSCLNAIYLPAADAVLETIRRASNGRSEADDV